jgi:RNA polymerase sigma-70 factor (ECF subfamily)
VTTFAGAACSPIVGRHEDDDDRRLAEQAKAADSDAFAVLYRRYVDRNYSYAWYRTRSREAAEDITSAVFERAWRAIARFEWRGGGFRPWLFRIAATETAAWHRGRGRRERLVARVASEPPPDDELVVPVDARVDDQVAALAGLRPRYQEAITLRYLSGFGPDEAAEVMGCSKATLAVTLHRAMNALRRAVGASS